MAPKQMEIEGTGRLEIPELEDAATAYVAARDKRMAMTEKEVVAKVNLMQVVLAHEKELTKNEKGERVYRFDDELVILKPGKANVKVKHAVDDEDEEEDED